MHKRDRLLDHMVFEWRMTEENFCDLYFKFSTAGVILKETHRQMQMLLEIDHVLSSRHGPSSFLGFDFLKGKTFGEHHTRVSIPMPDAGAPLPKL